MATEQAGCAFLIAHQGLAVLPLDQTAVIDSAVKGRTRVDRGDHVVLHFDSKYRPSPQLRTHLQFALRYEGVNLQVLALLFAAVGGGKSTCGSPILGATALDFAAPLASRMENWRNEPEA